MKNPTAPNFKTEMFPVFNLILSIFAAFYFRSKFPDIIVISWSDLGEPIKTISWNFLIYIWPVILSAVYLMFLFFPYFKINHQEGFTLKDQWHKAKELSLSFLFILQVIGGLLLSGLDKSLIWALPILFFLFFVSLIIIIRKIVKHRQKNPILY